MGRGSVIMGLLLVLCVMHTAHGKVEKLTRAGKQTSGQVHEDWAEANELKTERVKVDYGEILRNIKEGPNPERYEEMREAIVHAHHAFQESEKRRMARAIEILGYDPFTHDE